MNQKCLFSLIAFLKYYVASMLYYVTALNPKVNSPLFAATVAAAVPLQHVPGKPGSPTIRFVAST